MPTFTRAGVYVTEALAGPSSPPQQLSPSVAGFVGEHWRGPTAYAVQCNSWSDFLTIYGGFNPNATPALKNIFLAYAVYEYFANGGQSCWISRVPNTSATSGGVAAASAFAILKD